MRSLLVLFMISIFCNSDLFAGIITGKYLSVEAGMTESYIKADGLMRSCFRPMGEYIRPRYPAANVAFNCTFFSYVGCSIGFGWQCIGQSTEPRKIFLPNDLFVHDFESSTMLAYATIPILIKAGYLKEWLSVAGIIGIEPMLRVKKEFKWNIDGKNTYKKSKNAPPIVFWQGNGALSLGAEVGRFFRNDGIFLVGKYQYGLRDIAFNISGSAKFRSYGMALQYRRKL